LTVFLNKIEVSEYKTSNNIKKTMNNIKQLLYK